MNAIVIYDVGTGDADGQRRLRRVSRICLNYGVRVQKSVFECRISPAQRVMLENELTGVIDLEKDSIRIYDMGSKGFKTTHIGTKVPVDPEDVLMF